MKAIVLITGILLLAMAFALIGYEWKWRPDFLAQHSKPGVPVGFEGATKLPQNEVDSAIKGADQELDSRYAAASSLRFWSRLASWAGFISTSLMTIVIGFYGAGGQQQGTQPDLVKVFQEQQKSKGLIRIAGALVALATLPNLCAQRLDSDANQYTTSGRELNEVLVDSIGKIYDAALTL